MTTRYPYLTATAPTVTSLTLDGVVTAADPGTRTLTGRILTYGEVGHTSVGPVRFVAGALAAADPSRIKLLVNHDPAQVVGYATAIRDDAGALVATFHIADGAAGDAVLASAAARLHDGLSIGALPTTATMGADGVLDVTAAAWREVSVVSLPGFATGQVLQVAASAHTPVVVQAPPPALPPGYALPVVYAAARPVAGSWDQTPDRIAAAFRAGGHNAAIRAALTDIVPPAAGAEHDAMFRPQWLGELWQAIKIRRPIIEALGTTPLTSYKVYGFRRVRPALGVEVYAGNKAAVPSKGTFKMEPAEAVAQRVAGAHDIDRIFMDLGDGSFIRSYFQMQAENYALLSESLVAAQLMEKGTVLPGGQSLSVLEALTRTAAYLGQIGASVSFFKVASNLWADLLAIPELKSPWLLDGDANVADGVATIGNMTVSCDPYMEDSSWVAGDRRGATFYEWKNPPLQVEAQNIGNGGVDLGVFGYLALLVNDPRTIVYGTAVAGEASALSLGGGTAGAKGDTGPAGPAGPAGPVGPKAAA